MARLRLKKIESLIRREISDMIQKREIKDPRVGFVTVVSVEVTPDLRHAKVFITVLGDAKQLKSSFIGLKNAKGFIQGEIGNRLHLRFVPELEFLEDQGLTHAFHINELLCKIKAEYPVSEEVVAVEEEEEGEPEEHEEEQEFVDEEEPEEEKE